MFRPHQQRPGVVLLLGLLLMAAIVASTIAIATAVSSSSHQSKNLDDFLVASLGADSGLERSLAVVKTGRSNGSTIASATTTIKNTATQAVVTNGGPATFGVTAVPAGSSITVPQLRPFDSFTFDYFGYDANGFLANLTQSSIITVTGDDTSCVTPNAGTYPCNGQLEVVWVGLDAGGQPFYSGRQTYGPTQLDGTNTQSLNLFTNVHALNSDAPPGNIGSTRGFRITVRALDVLPHAPLTDAEALARATIKNIIVTPPAQAVCAGATICPTGVISLTSTGAAGTSQSVKTATILWQLPPSPLFNFVLFTEGSICPNSTTGC